MNSKDGRKIIKTDSKFNVTKTRKARARKRREQKVNSGI
jgi:hypothetical protein